MTVFCPNCGKPNTDAAQKCIACSAELKPAAAKGKFKGTMMMTGVAVPPPGQPAAPGAPPTPGAPAMPAGVAPTVASPAVPAPVAPPSVAGGGGVQAGSPQAKNLAFQKTMLGPVTPPGAGFPPAPGQPAPAPGGFGAPGPAQQPGGFGQPPTTPAAEQPAGFGQPSGGFGGSAAPPSDAAGAWGSAPATPGAEPGGAFGQPAGGGGFGASADQPPAPFGGGGSPGGFGETGGAPPAGGGFGPPPGGPGPGAPGAPGGAGKPGNDKTLKIVLFVGLGCLGFSVIACGVGFFLCKKAAEGAMESATGFAAEAMRIPLALSLGAIKGSCAMDASGAGASAQFHPSVFGELQGQACQVNDAVIRTFSDTTRSTAEMLNGTDDATVAERAGVGPDQCFRFTAGSAKIIGCNVPGGTFQLVHVEGLATVQ